MGEEDNWTRLLKAGVGAALLAKDRISEELEGVLEDMDLGELKREEIRESFLERTEEERGNLVEKVDDLLQERLEKMDFVRREEFEQLEGELEDLKKNLEND